jgi:hypothetical protein
MHRPSIAAALALVAFALPSCAYRTHHVRPYREDPGAAAALELAAQEWCRAMGEPAGPPQRPFTTDGCTCWPDGDVPDCCVMHDIAYWCGGPPELRAWVDRDFDRCVTDRGSGAQGSWMRAASRLTGHPWWPAPWRWGYGHSFPAAYYGLDGDESANRTDDGETPDALQ